MKPIDAERLEAVPETRLCMEHAEQIKKHGGEFINIVKQNRSSKGGSFKINYGSVDTERARNVAAINKLKDEHEPARHGG
jgi:hypothetical protein